MAATRSPRNYLSFLLQGKPEEVDAALARLFDAGCLGSEEIDFDGPGEPTGENPVKQRAYFSPETSPEILRLVLAGDFPSLDCGTARPVPESDWLANWKKSFSGFALGRRFYLCPSWESPPEGDRIVVRIDPERAFGTGTHDTTRLCLELIEERVRPRMPAIDAGCGTGILAIAAAKLGARPVLAIDTDPEATSCTETNVSRNALEEAIHVYTCSIARADLQPAHLVISNLNQSILRRDLDKLAGWVLPQGYLILSGLLLDQVAPMVENLPVDFRLIQTRTAGEWAAILVGRNSRA